MFGSSCFHVIVAEDSAGTRRSELVNWYLKEMEAEIETEAELNERKILAEKVIARLTNVVSTTSRHSYRYTVAVLPGNVSRPGQYR